MAPTTPSSAYDQALQGYQNTIGTVRAGGASLANQYNALFNQQQAYGASAKLALNQQYQQALANNQQSALAAGLGNTTVLQSGARGINYDYGNSLLALNDQLYQRQNQIRQAQLGAIQNNQQNVAQAYGAEAGFQGGYASQLKGIEAQYGLAGLQGQFSLQGQQLQNAAQLSMAALNQQYGQQQAAQQYGYQTGAAAQNAFLQAGLSNQQYGQQASLAQQQANNQAALSQMNYSQQVDYQNAFGYYRALMPGVASFFGPRLRGYWSDRRQSGRRGRGQAFRASEGGEFL